MSITDPLFDLEGRVVVLTGASSGIGASLAAALDARGAHVVLAARRQAALDDVAADLARSTTVRTDVGDPEQCQALIDAVLKEHGRVDVLINNAATYTVGPAEDDTIESIRHVLDTNLLSTIALSQAAGRAMLDSGSGSIINIASIFGLVGSGAVKQAAYAASKGGVVNLTRELSAQWSRRGVRVNAIAPGYFATEMTETMFEDEKSMRWLRRQAPMGRAGHLEELHGAVIFLASAASTYVTGVTLPVDGGWTSV